MKSSLYYSWLLRVRSSIHSFIKVFVYSLLTDFGYSLIICSFLGSAHRGEAERNKVYCGNLSYKASVYFPQLSFNSANIWLARRAAYLNFHFCLSSHSFWIFNWDSLRLQVKWSERLMSLKTNINAMNSADCCAKLVRFVLSSEEPLCCIHADYGERKNTAEGAQKESRKRSSAMLGLRALNSSSVYISCACAGWEFTHAPHFEPYSKFKDESGICLHRRANEISAMNSRATETSSTCTK